jgi:hypothetical protein
MNMSNCSAGAAPFTYNPAVLNLTPNGLYVLRALDVPVSPCRSSGPFRSLIEDARVEPRRILHVSVDGWRAGNLGLLVEAAKQLLPADSAVTALSTRLFTRFT